MKPEARGLAPQSAFVLVAILAASIFLVVVSFHQLLTTSEADSWDQLVYQVMLGYLMFVSLRSAALVVMSFADRYFHKPPPPPLRIPMVSVILPCFNEETVVTAAVKSALQIDYPNFEVLVVDDGSTDLTLLLARDLEFHSRVRVIYQANAGKAAALNRGIAEAHGDFVLCVDADSLLSPNVITEGLGYFEQDSGLAAVAGNVQIGNHGSSLIDFQRLEYVVGLNFQKTAQSFVKSVLIVPGPVGLFRREAVLDVGGYRSDTFAEDCDLTIRLLMAGYRTVYCPRMIAVTEAPEDFESLLKQRYRWSRGTLQAIKANSQWLKQPFQHPRNFFLLSFMIIETIVIPCANFIFAMFFIAHAASSGSLNILGPFFAQLTLLDVILTTYSSFFEPHLGNLVVLSLINRLTYGLAMEVLRFFSILDELVALPMNWNKLQRKGL